MSDSWAAKQRPRVTDFARQGEHRTSSFGGGWFTRNEAGRIRIAAEGKRLTHLARDTYA